MRGTFTLGRRLVGWLAFLAPDAPAPTRGAKGWNGRGLASVGCLRSAERPHSEMQEQKSCADPGRDGAVLEHGREYQHEAFSFDQCRVARNTKRHQKQSEDRPAVRPVRLADRAQYKRGAHNGAHPHRGEPQGRRVIEIQRGDGDIPTKVTPQDELPNAQFSKVTNENHRKGKATRMPNAENMTAAYTKNPGSRVEFGTET